MSNQNITKIKKFISFLGPVRTGHTFITSLLSSHKKIAISIELNPAYKVLEKNCERDKLFNIIINNCKKRTDMNRGGYEYFVKGAKQNLVKDVTIIGDSMAGYKYTKLIYKKKEINRFCSVIDLPIYWFNLYRNPYDVVHSTHLMTEYDISLCIDFFIKTVSMTEKICNYNTVKNNLVTFYLEDFILDPKFWLTNLLNFLGVERSPSYLTMCCSRVFKKPNKVIDRSVWKKKEIKKLNNFIKTIPKLERYYNDF